MLRRRLFWRHRPRAWPPCIRARFVTTQRRTAALAGTSIKLRPGAYRSCYLCRDSGMKGPTASRVQLPTCLTVSGRGRFHSPVPGTLVS